MTRLEAFQELAPIARRVASRYRSKIPAHVGDLDDLDNAALMGVWEAVNRHFGRDMSALTALAIVRARGAVIDYLRSQDWFSRRVRKSNNPKAMLSLDLMPAGTPLDPVLVSNSTPEDAAADNEVAGKKALKLEAALATLPPREALIVRRLLTGRKITEIALELGVSQPRVSQLRDKALSRVKAYLKATSTKGELW